jgi:hypothetical protein
MQLSVTRAGARAGIRTTSWAPRIPPTDGRRRRRPPRVRLDSARYVAWPHAGCSGRADGRRRTGLGGDPNGSTGHTRGPNCDAAGGSVDGRRSRVLLRPRRFGRRSPLADHRWEIADVVEGGLLVEALDVHVVRIVPPEKLRLVEGGPGLPVLRGGQPFHEAILYDGDPNRTVGGQDRRGPIRIAGVSVPDHVDGEFQSVRIRSRPS